MGWWGVGGEGGVMNGATFGESGGGIVTEDEDVWMWTMGMCGGEMVGEMGNSSRGIAEEIERGMKRAREGSVK